MVKEVLNMMRVYKSENELREIAEHHSKYINVRTMDGGNSRDAYRKATKRQAEVLYGVLYGALLGLNWGEAVRKDANMEQAIIDTAEFQADILMRPLLRDGEEMQGYLSVCIPLKRIVEKWEKK